MPTARHLHQPRGDLIHEARGEIRRHHGCGVGAPKHPQWYLNLVAEPNVTVQVKGERFAATARTAEGAERDRLWQLMCEVWPNYDQYQERTTRRIPVVVLERLKP